MKSRLAGAQKGHGLLKKKADALQMRFRMILKKIIDVMKNNIESLSLPFIHFFFSIILDQDIDGRCDEGGCIFTC